MAGPAKRQRLQELKPPANPPEPGGLCPMVEAPMPECHCAVLTSLKIPLVLAYCGKNYADCEIFRRWRQTQVQPVNQLRKQEDP